MIPQFLGTVSSGLILANTQIADGEQRMAEFGLAGNTGEVTMTFQDGSEEVLSVGDAVPGSEVASHYVFYQNGVYVVYDTYLKAFLYGEQDLVTGQLTPENGDSFTIQSASLSGSGFEEPIALELTDTQELSGYLLNSYQLDSTVLISDGSCQRGGISFFLLRSDRECSREDSADR